jgi:acyl carrier protein
LDVAEVVMASEDVFEIEIPDVEADKISIVDAVEYIPCHPMASYINNCSVS